MTPWEEACGKAATAPRRFLDWASFWKGYLPRLDPAEHLIYLGTHQSCYDDCCSRQLCDRSLVPYPELSVIGPYLAAISRDIDEPPQVDHPEMLHRRPPLYFDEAASGPHLTYVDLVSAYFSIYTRTTLDVYYDGLGPPRRGIIVFTDVDRLGSSKLVRNALLGTLRREWRRGIDHGHAFRERVPARRRRPMLWGLVMDSLELAMWTARDMGAVYVHTDGAIFTSATAAVEWQQRLRDQFQLFATIRASGPGWVRGIGNFSIADTISARPERDGNRIDSMLRAPYDLAEGLTGWLYHSILTPESGPYGVRGDPGTR